MTQVLTVLSVAAAIGWVLWRYRIRLFRRERVHVAVRLDRDAPGAHLIWHITNAATQPVTMTKLVVHGRHGANATFPTGLPRVLEPGDEVRIPTDVDWTLLGAKSIAVADADGREHVVRHDELATVQDHLRQLIDRRAFTASARDWLFGATDLAFGVVILGLGFFMLMWVIATG